MKMGGSMPSPNEKLAESLDELKALQQANRRVFRSDDLSRVHRERLVENGLRLFTPAAALVRVPESFFQLYPIESQVVMASLGDVSDVLRLLLNGGHSAKAGYLAKAFRQTGRADHADEILRAMKGAGYD